MPVPTTAVDLRNYLGATISSNNGASGNMICGSPGTAYDPSCLTSYYTGEVVIPNANGIIDYVAISSKTLDLGIGDGPIKEIGVSRNYPADAKHPALNHLRCFTTARSPSMNCAAPPNGDIFGAPYIINHLPVISWATVQATENNPDLTSNLAWPTRGIPGALITTPTGSDGFAPANYLNYTINFYSDNVHCAQSFYGNTYSLGTASYVPAIPFGGNIGTRDAVVLEGFSYANPSTLERYYYVSGIGRVRENNAQMASGQSSYGQNGQNVTRNYMRPVDLNIIYGSQFGNQGGCPQGSY
ncbi:MAG: hypothetical protein M3N13_09235 [Candidatus Eremiobacteraeota bacterium]|nr:hypothetical protein [Candidatus Eremiobacteraeota bacterium]